MERAIRLPVAIVGLVIMGLLLIQPILLLLAMEEPVSSFKICFRFFVAVSNLHGNCLVNNKVLFEMFRSKTFAYSLVTMES